MSLLQSIAKADFGGFSVVVVLLFFLFLKVLFPFLFLLFWAKEDERHTHISCADLYRGSGGSRPPAKFKFL